MTDDRADIKKDTSYTSYRIRKFKMEDPKSFHTRVQCRFSSRDTVSLPTDRSRTEPWLGSGGQSPRGKFASFTLK